MYGRDRAREAVVGHLRDLEGLDLGEGGAGGHDSDGGVSRPGARPRGAPSRAERRMARASAKPLPSAVRTPATTRPVAGSMMSPAALTATSAATTVPSAIVIAAVPIPAFIMRVGPANLPTVAPAPAPIEPSRRDRWWPRWPPRSRTPRWADLGLAAHAEVEQDRRGHDRHLGHAGVVAEVRRSSSQRTTPLAASSPKALPPDRTIALTFCTWFTG
jgi:hypothetical protein